MSIRSPDLTRRLATDALAIAQHGAEVMLLNFINNGTALLKAPGFGQHIEFRAYWDRYLKRYHMDRYFRHSANDFRADGLTVRKVAMLRLIHAITGKPS